MSKAEKVAAILGGYLSTQVKLGTKKTPPRRGRWVWTKQTGNRCLFADLVGPNHPPAKAGNSVVLMARIANSTAYLRHLGASFPPAEPEFIKYRCSMCSVAKPRATGKQVAKPARIPIPRPSKGIFTLTLLPRSFGLRLPDGVRIAALTNGFRPLL